MKGPNLSEWALGHRPMMRFLIVVSVIAGLYGYWSLGRQEDPDITIKTMLVSAAWPGASAQQMADQVAGPIERAVTSVAQVKTVTTNAQPGRLSVTVDLRDDVAPAAVAGLWTLLRQRVGDRAGELPDGVQGPRFNDDFGDAYGNIYALTGDGFALPRLKTFADQLRAKIEALPDAGRVEVIGAREERVYVEYSSAKLALLGIDPQAIGQTLRATNAVAPAGVLNVTGERVRLSVTGAFDSVDAIRNIGIAAGGRTVRLGDAATVTRRLVDPPETAMRFNGADAVGVLVSLRRGGNSDRLGNQIAKLVAAFQAQVPLGLSVHTVANQPEVVKEAIGEFTRSLAEAVAIVLVVSLITLGWRPGLVVALCIPIVLAQTFAAMLAFDIPLHRVSLGALIIALGLLVDDAIIVVEQIETHLKSGWDKARAASSAYLITAQPMLIGTFITAIGFMPIALAQSGSGEYTRAIFEVVAISLVLSWLVAVFVTPFIANWLLPEAPHHESTAKSEARSGDHDAAYDGRFYRAFRATVTTALAQRWFVIGGTAALFVASIALFAVAVPQQFFPTSDRPELLVDLRLTQTANFATTSDVAQRLEHALRGDPDVAFATTYVGQGTPRFYLSLGFLTPGPSIAQVIVQTKGGAARERVAARVQTLLDTRFPEVRGRISTLELGPAIGQPLQIRVTGDDYAAIAPAADRIEAMMRGDARVRGVNKDYGEPLKAIRLVLDQDKARLLGVTTHAVQQALRGAVDGEAITTYREGDQTLVVMARLQADERESLDRMGQAQVPTASGRAVPVTQVARIVPAFEPAELNRRAGRPAITVMADVLGAEPADVVEQWGPRLDAIRAALPAGVALEMGGTVEGSAESQASVLRPFPLAIALILLLLMIQLQSAKKMLVVVSTGPLALIGVAAILATFRIPFGFVAMLGVLALFGMVIRNSVILVSQIELLGVEGRSPFDSVVEATVHRLRPILLTALTAILAMIPLTRSIFWGPMAWAIMGGLMVATLLTLIFLPALYAAVFGVRRDETASEGPDHA